LLNNYANRRRFEALIICDLILVPVKLHVGEDKYIHLMESFHLDWQDQYNMLHWKLPSSMFNALQ